MTIIRKKIRFSKIKNDFLEKWRNIPTSIAGDCMNRQNIMSERIKPIIPGRKLFGQARTVSVVQGDNSAIHAALTLIKKDEIKILRNVSVPVLSLSNFPTKNTLCGGCSGSGSANSP